MTWVEARGAATARPKRAPCTLHLHVSRNSHVASALFGFLPNAAIKKISQSVPRFAKQDSGEAIMYCRYCTANMGTVDVWRCMIKCRIQSSYMSLRPFRLKMPPPEVKYHIYEEGETKSYK